MFSRAVMLPVLIAALGLIACSGAVPTPPPASTSASATPTLMPASVPTPTSAPELSYRTGEIPPCTPIQGSSVDPCEPDVAQVSSNDGLVDIGPEPWSVRFFLDGGRGRILVGHLVLRGTYIPGTVRCIADNTARFPSYMGWRDEDGPLDVSEFKCYADVRVNAYILGSGPSTLTVRLGEYWYWVDETPGNPEDIEKLRSSLERVFIEGEDDIWWVTAPTGGIAGREAVLFVGPAVDVSAESWEVFGTSAMGRSSMDTMGEEMAQATWMRFYRIGRR